MHNRPIRVVVFVVVVLFDTNNKIAYPTSRSLDVQTPLSGPNFRHERGYAASNGRPFPDGTERKVGNDAHLPVSKHRKDQMRINFPKIFSISVPNILTKEQVRNLCSKKRNRNVSRLRRED